MRNLLAALPIAVLITLLLGLRWSGARSAWIALAVALMLVVAPFQLAPTLTGSLRSLVGVVAEGVFISATILWILLPALAIHQLQVRTGALQTINEAIARAVPSASGKLLLVGFFFALFLEGAAGFGTPIAVTAPMLVALGLAPVTAVAVALLGHVAGVVFGAVGTPVIAQSELLGVAAEAIARDTMFLLLPVAWIPALMMLRLQSGENADTRARWSQGLLAFALFAVPYAATAYWIGPELPTLAGAVLGGLAFVLISRRDAAAATLSIPPSRLLRAAMPYLIAIALILATRLVAPLRAATQDVVIEWKLFDVFAGSMVPLYHPGTLLFAALLAAAALRAGGRAELWPSLRAAARRLAPAIIALVAMLTLSRLMLHAGMIRELGAAAVGAGEYWPAVAPLVGALGSFVTGSATASNVLFSNLQQQAATALQLSTVLMLAAQCAGAAVGNALCPHNIIAGAAAVGVAGREGAILRKTLAPCLAMLVLIGALTLALSRLG